MDYTIYLHQSENFKMFVDRNPDVQEDNIYRFAENRIIPVYFYFPKYKTGHLIRTCPGNCTLPYINQPVQNLLSARGASQVNKLLDFTNNCRRNKVVLDDMPDQFFIAFSLAMTGSRKLTKEKLIRIYWKYK